MAAKKISKKATALVRELTQNMGGLNNSFGTLID